MINVKKGTAHSLQQADVRGTWITGVVSGMVCYVDGTDNPGQIAIGAVPLNKTGILGFAINDSTDGDAIESNKIALYTLDGQSVIETDQVTQTVNSTNFPIGTPVYAAVTTGLVTNVATGQAGPIGWVEGIRSLQADLSVAAGSQNYPSTDSSGNTTTKSINVKVQKNVPCLSIKLASFSTARTA